MAKTSHPSPEVLAEATKTLATALVRVGAALKRIHPDDLTEQLVAFVNAAARSVGDLLSVEEEK
jgi:hypothetical protein